VIGVPFGKYSRKSGGPARSPIRNRAPAGGGGGWDTKSYAFDGTLDRVDVDGVVTGTTNFDFQDEAHTISVWFKTTTAAKQAVWSFGDNRSTTWYYLQVQGTVGSDGPRVKFLGKSNTAALFGRAGATSSPNGTTGEVWVQSDDTNGINPTDGNWHNVIVTFSGQASTDEALKIYIDGNYVGFSQTRGTDVTWDEFTVGVLRTADGDDTEQFFIGNIAQISMWTSALSAENATAVYAMGNSMDTRTLTPAPVHLYRFGDGDDNGPGTLTDYGSGDKDGTSEGDPTIVTDSPP
tara:strand:+ start:567 stop:1442 length:876 start_codon:yes stop_codon:yes gene_type:complete